MKQYLVITVSVQEHTLITKTTLESFADGEEATKHYNEKRVDGNTISCGLYTLIKE